MTSRELTALVAAVLLNGVTCRDGDGGGGISYGYMPDTAAIKDAVRAAREIVSESHKTD